MNFGSYFYNETCKTLKPIEEIEFVGDSLPYHDSVRHDIESEIGSTIPLHRVDIHEFYSVHTKEYLDSFIALSRGEDAEIQLSVECANLQYAIPGYEYSLGGVCKTIEMMKAGILDRAYCFSMPGHHAFPGKGHGYCALNAMAAGVRYAQSSGFKKILIADWDIHHGDGTQTIFENDENVHHISVHSAVDLYMSVVKSAELGTTAYADSVGQVNIPILDDFYTEDFFYNELGLRGNIYRGAESVQQFQAALDASCKPDLIMIFDGHDSHKEDCGRGTTKWEDEDFETLTKSVVDLSVKHNCPLLSMPGGGYNFHKAVELSLLHAKILKEYRV
ncbi:hypothetical protein QUF72_01865 [Desulfobacterales bacterium HSG2]|nr:hypothetical protein [Desulfobacterales bacterium HSG2]